MKQHLGMSICALAALAALPCVAQSGPNPWNGSWKAEPSSLRFESTPFSLAIDPTGYTLTAAGAPPAKTVCDGQPHAVASGVSVTCTKHGKAYSLSTIRNGKVTSKSDITLAGKVMTRKIQYFPADGSPTYSMTFTSKRVGEGKGMSGSWTMTGVIESQDTGVMSIAVSGDGNIAFKETDQDKPTICALDGTPTKFPDGSSMAVKLEGPHTLKVIYRSTDGVVRRENTFVLSLDGKTISETDFTPGPASSTTAMLLHKM